MHASVSFLKLLFVAFQKIFTFKQFSLETIALAYIDVGVSSWLRAAGTLKRSGSASPNLNCHGRWTLSSSKI